MKYGYFSKDNLEFLVTNPNTPRPWINYLTNENYCAIISQTAGGYSFYKDCGSDRIIRWAPENYITDRPGRYVFIKDTNNDKCWSATYQPLREKPQYYRCYHGLGYTTIKTVYHGIQSEITYFVPHDDSCEIWLVRLTNNTNKKRSLNVYPYVEWLIGDYQLELRYRNILNLYNRVCYDKDLSVILAKKTAAWGDFNIQPFKYLAFFYSSLPIKGAATRKVDFLGRYNTEENPASILGTKFKGTKFCSGEDGIACYLHKVNLGPQMRKEFVVIAGQTENKDKVKRIIDRYKGLSSAKKALQETKDLWYTKIVNNIKVQTPDKKFNQLINIWTKYQLYICNYWSRSPSYYHEGSGGRGYRDSSQDAEAITSINPEHARKKIKTVASIIREDGTTAPGWSETGGPFTAMPNKDHPVWLTSTVAAYINETGDANILKFKLPYLKDRWIKGWEIDLEWKKGTVFKGKGTLFEHLYKNLNFTYHDVGKRGLPLIGHADWNDGIDAAGIKGKGESVWLAQALVRSLKILAELANLVKKSYEANILRKRARIMTERINKVSWDGNWYLRGFTDDDFAYGSAKNKKGKIFLNSQSWAILSGVANKERTKRLIKSVDKYLDSKYGLALFYPAYSAYDKRLGRMTMFSEGTKENAAIFCHAVLFKVVADCMIKRGNKAYENLRKIMPNNQDDYERYRAEPYVFSEYLIGPEHPYRYGEGAFSWITGTAGWVYIAATEWILGVRKEYGGLRISPSIPSNWRRFKITRPFRQATYEIEVENPKGKKYGVREIYVDGKKQTDNLIKPHRDKKVHNVRVIMG